MARSEKNYVVQGLCFVIVCVTLAVAYRYGLPFRDTAVVGSEMEVSEGASTAFNSSNTTEGTAGAQVADEFDFNSPAQKINDGRCHMDQCSWTTTLSVETVEERNGSILKKMRFVSGTTPDDGTRDKKRITWSDEISEVYVLCSKRLPSVLLETDGQIQTDVLDFSVVNGVLTGAAGLYVEVCHGLNHMGYAGDGFMERFGYVAGGPYSPSADEAKLIEIRSPEQIFEFDN